jgi:1-acyl-sn-glycerol-3-phosphate acyltransferase
MEEWKYQPAKDLGQPFGQRLKSLKRESGLVGTLFHVVWWGLVRCYLRVFHRYRVRGREHLPKEPPFLLVANHASHLDVLVLAALCPYRIRDRVFPIAAGDTFFEKLPVATFAAYALNALPLWRKRCHPRDLEAMRTRLLDEPCVYVLFPEGTRSRNGEMAPFRQGIGALVAASPVPVVPCYLDGAFAALPPHRLIPRPRRITVTLGAPLRFPATPNDKGGWGEVAAQAEAAVRLLRGHSPR